MVKFSTHVQQAVSWIDGNGSAAYLTNGEAFTFSPADINSEGFDLEDQYAKLQYLYNINEQWRLDSINVRYLPRWRTVSPAYISQYRGGNPIASGYVCNPPDGCASSESYSAISGLIVANGITSLTDMITKSNGILLFEELEINPAICTIAPNHQCQYADYGTRSANYMHVLLCV